jgi:hypothetical protein
MSHQLKGLYGVAYSCSNSSNTYCDDWYTDTYKNVFNSLINNNPLLSARSLQTVKSLGFNHIRTYYLDPNKDHSTFLTLCSQLNLSIEIGISNDLLENRDIENIQKLINSVKQYKCVTIYTVGNEYFGDINNIIFAIELIYSLDSNKYIMHSSIFDNQFATAKLIYSKIPNYILSKYIVGINIYFYNNVANTHGDVIQNVIKEYYLDSLLQNSYLIISEFGNNKNEEQWNSLWNFSWGNSECMKKYPKYLGYSLFSFSNEGWKGGHNGENNYGIVNENGKPKDGYYAVREFKKTDGYKNTIKKNLY